MVVEVEDATTPPEVPGVEHDQPKVQSSTIGAPAPE
jgi:hypothetical protein